MIKSPPVTPTSKARAWRSAVQSNDLPSIVTSVNQAVSSNQLLTLLSLVVVKETQDTALHMAMRTNNPILVAILCTGESESQLTSLLLPPQTSSSFSADTSAQDPDHTFTTTSSLSLLPGIAEAISTLFNGAGASILGVAAASDATAALKVFLSLLPHTINDPASTAFPGWTALHLAAATRSKQALLALIESGASRIPPQCLDGTVLTPLALAAAAAQPEAVEVLLANTHDPSESGIHLKTGPYAASPLHLAVRAGDLRCIQLLLEAGSDPNAGPCPPLVLAVSMKSEDAIELLLKAGADPSVQALSPPMPIAWSAFTAASAVAPAFLPQLTDSVMAPTPPTNPHQSPPPASQTHLEDPNLSSTSPVPTLSASRSMLSFASTSPLQSPKESASWTANSATALLMAAAAAGDADGVASAFSMGANALDRGPDGRTAFHVAASSAFGDRGARVIQALLETRRPTSNNNSPPPSPNSTTASAGSARSPRPAYLLQWLSSAGEAPIHTAASANNLSVLSTLIEAGADPQALTPSKAAPIHLAAAASASPAIIQALISAGANPTVPGGRPGWTPLHWASAAAAPGVVSALLVAGATPDPDLPLDDDEEPPPSPVLLAAAAAAAGPISGKGLRAALEVIRMLVDAGADLSASSPSTGWSVAHFLAAASGTRTFRPGGASKSNPSPAPELEALLTPLPDPWDPATGRTPPLTRFPSFGSLSLTSAAGSSSPANTTVSSRSPPEEAEGEDSAALAASTLLADLLKQGASPHAPTFGPEGWRPLHSAAVHGSVSATSVLLKAGAPPDGSSPSGTPQGRVPAPEWTPLMLVSAAWVSLPPWRRRAVSVALVRAGAASPLHAAARAGDSARLTALLASGPRPLDTLDPNGATPLMWAARGNHVQSIRALLHAGADPTILTPAGWSALHVAARHNAASVIRPLLEAQSAMTPTAPAPGGATSPVVVAASHKSHDALLALLEAGLEPDPHALVVIAGFGPSPGFNALLQRLSPLSRELFLSSLTSAASSGSLDAFKAVLAASPEANEISLQQRLTPLIAAVEANSPEMIGILLEPLSTTEQSKLVSMLNDHGEPPLLRGSAAGAAAAVSLLLKHGAAPTVRSPGGATPLGAAVRSGSASTVSVILASGGPVRSSALASASGALNYRIVRVLCRALASSKKSSRGGDRSLSGPVGTAALMAAVTAKVHDEVQALDDPDEVALISASTSIQSGTLSPVNSPVNSPATGARASMTASKEPEGALATTVAVLMSAGAVPTGSVAAAAGGVGRHALQAALRRGVARRAAVKEMSLVEGSFSRTLTGLVSAAEREGAPEEWAHIVPSLKILATAASRLSAALEVALGGWSMLTSRVGSHLYATPRNKSVVAAYVAVASAYPDLISAASNHPQWKEARESEFEEAWSRGTVEDALIAPIQRLAQAPMTVAAMVAATPDCHPDYEDLTTALSAYRILADRVNGNAGEEPIDVVARLAPDDNVIVTSGDHVEGRRSLVICARRVFVFDDKGVVEAVQDVRGLWLSQSDKQGGWRAVVAGVEPLEGRMESSSAAQAFVQAGNEAASSMPMSTPPLPKGDSGSQNDTDELGDLSEGEGLDDEDGPKRMWEVCVWQLSPDENHVETSTAMTISSTAYRACTLALNDLVKDFGRPGPSQARAAARCVASNLGLEASFRVGP